jgi:hypothetical protein
VCRTSFRFLALMHGFRRLTERGTRADGDPFYVKYVGHPMQGSVAGRIWLLHDPRYGNAEFGRAAAFAWACSEQFEIGP